MPKPAACCWKGRAESPPAPTATAACWRRLERSGALDDIERRGIRQLFYFQVDNPLVDICGPEFVGYHLLSGSEFSTQVVAKRDPLERVGNVVQVDGRLMVIEYSDLPDEAAQRRNPDGSLAIWAGSIAVHVIDAALLRRTADAADGLPFHVARKKVACLDAAGRRIEPSQPNAIKFERFIFDLMPQARRAIVVEVDPARAFAPLKNEPGAKADTPENVRARTCVAASRLAPPGRRRGGRRRGGRDQPAVRARRGRVADEGFARHADHGADVFRRFMRRGGSRRNPLRTRA